MSILGGLLDGLKGVNIIIGEKEAYINGDLSGILNPGQHVMKKDDNISSVHTCVRILSDAVSRLPLNVMYMDADGNRLPDKEDYRYSTLHYNPNPYTTSQRFWATIEAHRNLHGNAYAKIIRENGKLKSLQIIPPSLVIGADIVNDQLYYQVTVKNKKKPEPVNSNDMLHFIHSAAVDGIFGISPLTKLRLNISTSWKGQKTIDSFYQNNATTTKAITYTPGTNRKAAQEQINKFKQDYAGPTNAGKILSLPDGANIVDMSISFQDAQFIDTIKYNTSQIGALYGVPSHLLGIMDGAKFSTVEQMGLDFKVNTLASILRMYRQEMEFKLLTEQERLEGKSIEFNTNSLVETDQKSRIEALTKEIQFGMLSPNDANRIEGQPTYEGGDLHYSPFNMGFTEYRVQEEQIKLEALQQDPSSAT